MAVRFRDSMIAKLDNYEEQRFGDDLEYCHFGTDSLMVRGTSIYVPLEAWFSLPQRTALPAQSVPTGHYYGIQA